MRSHTRFAAVLGCVSFGALGGCLAADGEGEAPPGVDTDVAYDIFREPEELARESTLEATSALTGIALPQIKPPTKVYCSYNAILSGNPSAKAPKGCPKKAPQGPGASCSWADECDDGIQHEDGVGVGLCVRNGWGAGVCARMALSECPADAGNGAVWASAVNNYSCAAGADHPSRSMCTVLYEATPLPSCAEGLDGGDCKDGEPCADNDNCVSGECFKKYPEQIGVCVPSCYAECPADHQCADQIWSGNDPVFLCEPNAKTCAGD